jgi:MoxR-like ATPase
MEKIQEILTNVSRVIIGKNETISCLLTGVLCGGHLLIEDVPGVGKTTLVKTLAKTLGCSFKRIQFTPDLMPSDIVGLSVYDKDRGEFRFKPGPIMSQIVLADEINRTSPKTQASLLEAMAERQVTVDGVTYALPEPFIVMATQNPIEYEGTYPLPEAQMDRFMMRLNLGYPERQDEQKILKMNPGSGLPEEVDTVISPGDLMDLQHRVDQIHMAEPLEGYIVSLTQGTRIHPDVLLGVSPRGGQYLYRAAKGAAFVRNRDYVLPDDVKAMVIPVFSHRLILKPEAKLKGRNTSDVLQEILLKTHVPVILDGRN